MDWMPVSSLASKLTVALPPTQPSLHSGPRALTIAGALSFASVKRQVAQRDVRVGAAGARAAGVHALHDEADLVDAAVEVPPEVQPRAEAGAADLGGAADPPVVVLVHDPGRPPGALSVLVVPVPLAAERDDRGVGRRRQADLAPHTARRGRAGALHVQAGDLRGRRPRTSGAGEHRREVVADPHGAAVAVSATLSDRVGARAGGRAEHQCHE